MWCWRTIRTWTHCIKVASACWPHLLIRSLFVYCYNLGPLSGSGHWGLGSGFLILLGTIANFCVWLEVLSDVELWWPLALSWAALRLLHWVDFSSLYKCLKCLRCCLFSFPPWTEHLLCKPVEISEEKRWIMKKEIPRTTVFGKNQANTRHF